MKTDDSKPSKLGDIFEEYHYCENPVTKWSLLQTIVDRLNRLEEKTND